jgi:hypothetical protein
LRESEKNTGLTKKMPGGNSRTAPKMRHPPVDSLHSIDFPADKTLPFLLTLEMKGVKTNRSLIASGVFPVGAASGAQAKSLSASQDDGKKAGKGL